MRIVLLAMALLVLQIVSAQPLTKEEKAILARIDAQMPETLKLLEEMVNINSGTLNVSGVRKVGDLLDKA
ncbi:MAG: hypothetical protein ACK5OP_07200, partial [Sphingobacteriales bacterium]